MTYRTATRGQAASAATSASPKHRLAGLLAELESDDLVRPELHNAAILGTRHAVPAPRSTAPASRVPTRRA